MLERLPKLPLLAFGLTFSALVLLALIRGHFAAGSPRSQVPEPIPSGVEVAGWRGPAKLAAAGLELTLAPLHSDPKRQAYDAVVLAERLALPPGQPLRLEVHGEGGTELDALAAAAGAGLLSVDDRDGQAARLLFFAATETGAGSLPILGLFDPRGTLGSSDGGRLIFWGREPGAGARLIGTGIEWDLTPTALVPGDLPTYVASRGVVAGEQR